MNVIKLLPGLVLSVAIAFVAVWVENLLPVHLIGGAVIAMFLGMLINHFVGKNKWLAPGLKFTSKKVLKFAIILLGLSLNISTILHVGRLSLTVMVFTLLTCFGGGHFIGKALGLNWKLSNLISAGTGICGGSAIAAAAPALKAKDGDIALASATVFTLNAVALLIFPWIGRALGFTDSEFGYFAALAIHDTSSVVGASFQYGEQALEIGTTVKLARALWIVPVTLFIATFVAPREPGEKRKFKLKVPWFIPGFIIAAAIVTYVPGTAQVGGFLKEISKYLMVMTLFIIGANLSRQKLKELGIRPLIHGIALWLILSAVWCLAIHFGWVKTI